MKIKKFSSKILITKEWLKDSVINQDWFLRKMSKIFKEEKKEPKDQKDKKE